MTKVKKLLKKAFTLVELVVVVAIIAILSGVSVAAYVGITDRANKAADQDVVAQLNLQLASEEAVEGKNTSCYEAIKDCITTGLNVEEMTPNTKNSKFVWDQENDRFAIVDDEGEIVAQDSTRKLTSKQELIWALRTTYVASKNSIYLLNGFVEPAGGLTISSSIDTGLNQNIRKINYIQPNSDTDYDVVIRTNLFDCELSIDASAGKADIKHYGIVGSIENIATASTNKYVEYGTVGRMILANGSRVSFENGSTAYCVMHKADESATISKSLQANLYDYLGNKNRDFDNIFNNDSANFYSPLNLQYYNNCHHVVHSYLFDAKSVYDVCYGCGRSLITLKSDCNHISKVSSFCYNDDTKEIQNNNLSLGSYNFASPWKMSVNNLMSDVIGGQVRPTPTEALPTLTIDQQLCSHDNLTYSAIAGNTEFHKCTCTECGFSFTDKHSSGDTCDKCLLSLHEWDPSTHKCTIHNDDCYNFTYTTCEDLGSKTIEFSMCGNSIKIWGFNDDEKAVLDPMETIEEEVGISTMFEGKIGELDTYDFFYNNNEFSIEFMNATYIPTYFLGNASTYSIDKLILPDTIEKLGAASLSIQSLTSVKIPYNEHITLDLQSAFSISGLRSVAIPASVKKLPASAFAYCKSLSNVVLPSGLTEIESGAFHGCTNLEEIFLPSSLTRINVGSFAESGLKVIYYDGTVNQWKNNVTIFYTDNVVEWFSEVSADLVICCKDGEIRNN